MNDQRYSEITPLLAKLAAKSETVSRIDSSLYDVYDVKRGLRDLSGKGVLAGLTDISTVIGKEKQGDTEIPCTGRLYYRGINIRDLVTGFVKENRFGFEEAAYLLIFGSLPDEKELREFKALLCKNRDLLPAHFVRDIIMAAPSSDMMNVLARSALTLYAYDEQADDISPEGVLRQCLSLVSLFPLISVYGYQIYQHYYNGKSLYIHSSDPSLSMSPNILHLLRKGSSFTPLEAKLLDLCLVLHMEHGGGNNSTFTTHVVSSTGTDTYSVFASSLGSLKGPRHGGANIKVVHMMNDLKEHVKDWTDEKAIEEYLSRLLSRDGFDHSGLIYGFGHAVYSLSDPRAEVLRESAALLCEEKGLMDEFRLYETVQRLAPRVISEHTKIYKGVCANVDFYSGLVYSMLNLPEELYTPLFAIARTVGWSAHRMEELTNRGKIIRPAYVSVSEDQPYIPMNKR